MWAHYLARALGLVALAVGVNMFFSHHNSLRADITSEKLNSLSPRTVQAGRTSCADNDDVKTIKIDAYVSPQVPAEYAAHKLNLLSTLAELSSLSGGKIHGRRPRDRELQRRGHASPRRPTASSRAKCRRIDRGVRGTEEIFLGVAFTLRPRQRRDSVPRQGHSRRVRAGALDLHGRRPGAQEAGRGQDRRAALRRLLDARPDRRIADHRRAARSNTTSSKSIRRSRSRRSTTCCWPCSRRRSRRRRWTISSQA